MKSFKDFKRENGAGINFGKYGQQFQKLIIYYYNKVTNIIEKINKKANSFKGLKIREIVKQFEFYRLISEINYFLLLRNSKSRKKNTEN